MSNHSTCEAWSPNSASYFLETRIVPQRCGRPSKYLVLVNPPKPNDDGKVGVCGLCNSFLYHGFPRESFQ